MGKYIPPLSVVISTRKIDDEYLRHVSKAFSHPKTEIIIYENDGEYSLPQLYNKGVQESTNDIVVFMHDDLIIETPNITTKIHRLFEQNPEYGIIGIAGTDNLITGRWWDIKESMQGIVKHQHEGRTWKNEYSKKFGDGLKEVVIVDGLFFATHKGRVLEWFDDEFPGFHFYDLPFCVRNHIKGVKVGVTTKLSVIHKSIGMVDKKWEKNKLFFEAKYGHHLPLTV